jgi:hypothetical protein
VSALFPAHLPHTHNTPSLGPPWGGRECGCGHYVGTVSCAPPHTHNTPRALHPWAHRGVRGWVGGRGSVVQPVMRWAGWPLGRCVPVTVQTPSAGLCALCVLVWPRCGRSWSGAGPKQRTSFDSRCSVQREQHTSKSCTLLCIGQLARGAHGNNYSHPNTPRRPKPQGPNTYKTPRKTRTHTHARCTHFTAATVGERQLLHTHTGPP